MLPQSHSCILIACAWEKDLVRQRGSTRERGRQREEKKSIASPGVTIAVIAFKSEGSHFLMKRLFREKKPLCILCLDDQIQKIRDMYTWLDSVLQMCEIEDLVESGCGTTVNDCFQ